MASAQRSDTLRCHSAHVFTWQQSIAPAALIGTGTAISYTPLHTRFDDNINNWLQRDGHPRFEAEDYLLFYGEGPSIWRFSRSDGCYVYKMHAYANYNYYFLTPDGTAGDSLRVQPSTLNESNSPDRTVHTGVALYHEDRINTHGGGQIWVSDKFTPNLNSRSFTLTLPEPPA